MKIKTAEATELQLNWLVAKCEGYQCTFRPISGEIVYAHENGEYHFGYNWAPSTKWVQGGPIIERERIWWSRNDDAISDQDVWWCLSTRDPVTGEAQGLCEQIEGLGPTLLIAAMRCYVASKLGNEVEIPEDLA